LRTVRLTANCEQMHHRVRIRLRQQKDKKMAAAYSMDLRKRILKAWQAKEGSQRKLAERFKVSLAFIRDLLKRYRETGEIAARPQGGDRRSKLKGADQDLLRDIVTRQNDLYLREIQAQIKEKRGIEVSTSSLCRTLQRQQLGRKKKR
jgi:transposase